MRIGLVTGEFPPMVGGVGAYSHILAQTLCDQGHTVRVFSSVRAGSQGDNIKVTAPVKTWGIGSLYTIHRWATAERLDVVNLQFQTAAYKMSPWIHFLPDTLRSIPVVTTFHDLRFPYLFPKAGRLRDWMVMRLAKVSDGVIVTNHEDMARMRKLSKVALIPIGSNILKNVPTAFNASAWRAKASARENDFLLAYFGLINRSKGLETLLQSMAQLRKDDVPVRLVIIGGGAGTSDPTNAAFIQEMNQLIETLGLKPFVQQTGFVDEETVGAYLTASDAVVLPFADGASYRRGSLMAAIRYGCTIISTTPRVPIPTFRDGENMLLVKPDDAPALEAAIRRLIEAPKLRQQLRDGAAVLAHEFEWPKIASATTDFFRWVIEEKTTS